METALVQERALEESVHRLLTDTTQPVEVVFQAFASYRELCQANLLADLQKNAVRETSLWEAHTAGKQYFHRALSGLRKQGEEAVVATRTLIKFYLKFLKDSERFYRGYIHQLHVHFGGIPELEAVAQQVQQRNGDSHGSESSLQVSPELRARALLSCHQTLIYLGDLARYRATDKLDKNPNFGPAIGYYGLACNLRPTSGLGYHQQAVVALAQSRRNDLRAIYHFYRAIVVEDPHPNAARNLQLEFDKTNRSWSRGDPLNQGSTNDKDAPKYLLIGWFVRMHSMCYKGEQFGAYNELEQTLLRQLTNVASNPALDVETALLRMVIVNLAAQYNASELFQREASMSCQQAFFYFFRFNVSFYTSLLQTFHNSLLATKNAVGDMDNITTKLTPVMRRVLPALRLYGTWLLENIFLLDGLKDDDFLRRPIDNMWQAYAQVLDFVADEENFGIWALEDFEATYMLEEDTDTLGFKPLLNGDAKVPATRSRRNWFGLGTGALKPRFSDTSVVRLSTDEEMLVRLKDLLEDGLYLCHDESRAPLTLLLARIYYGSPPESAVQAAEAARQQPSRPLPKPKPLSYAKAAAKLSAKSVGQVPKRNNTTSSTTSSRAQQNSLSRMVNDLVDDEDGDNNPVTPPQQYVAHPAIVANGEGQYMNGYGAQDFSAITSHQPKVPTSAMASSPQDKVRASPSNSAERLRSGSVSGLWHTAPVPTSPSFPSGLPMGTLGTPTQARGHSRMNSASSIRSRTSAQLGAIGDSWSSLDAVHRPDVQALHAPTLAREGPMDGYAKFSESALASPLLFGASGSMWSANGSGESRAKTVWQT